MAVPTPLTGEEIKAKFRKQAEENKYMHNPGAKPAVPMPPSNAVGAIAGASIPGGYTPPSTPQTPVPTPQSVPTPSYGSNISNFDPNNDQHKALADAGQQWAAAKAKGDQAGMDAAAKLGEQIRAWLGGSTYNAKTGVSTLSVPMPQMPKVAEQVPAPNTPYMQLTPGQIQQEAGYQIGKERADLKNSVDWMIAQAKNNANYANQQIQDNRVLEDAKIARSLNPFSGRTTYDKAMIGRGRAIDDNYRATNLQNDLTKIQTDLYNFDKLAPDKQRSLINEMTRIERDYGLQVGQLTGWFGNQRTLAGQQFDWSKDPSNPAVVGQNISNKIAQLQLDNLPAQTKLELQQLEQRAKQGDIDLKTAEWQLKELTDPNSVTNKSKALQLEMQQLEAKNLPEEMRIKLQATKKQLANIGKSEAEAEYDKLQVEKIKAEIDKIKNGTSSTPKIDAKDSAEYYNEAKGYVDSMTKSDATTYANGIRDYLTDSDYRALLKYIDEEL